MVVTAKVRLAISKSLRHGWGIETDVSLEEKLMGDPL
jgi:hypothetical protein